MHKLKLYSQEKIRVGLNTSVQLWFSVEETIKLESKDYQCEKDINYDWTNCVMNQGIKQVGCSLNWFKNHSSYPACETVEQMRKMQKYLKSVKVKKLKHFDCLFPCSTKHFKVQKIVETPKAWNTPWVSEVIIDLDSYFYEKKTEYYVYDQVKRKPIL